MGTLRQTLVVEVTSEFWVVRLCECCGSEFQVLCSRLKHASCRFCGRYCRGLFQRGAQHPSWKGGVVVDPARGYIRIHQPEHPNANARGYVYKHVLEASANLGRPMRLGEHVHHLNEYKSDNDPKNLEVKTASAHQREHAGWEVRKGVWFKPCSTCRQLFPANPDYFGSRGRQPGLASRCLTCDRTRRRKPLSEGGRGPHKVNSRRRGTEQL